MVEERRTANEGRATILGRISRGAMTQGLLGIAMIIFLGCASSGTPALSEPSHPFSRWVSELETGTTSLENVLERFGDPGEIEEEVRGGVTWRYSFPEIRWPAGDPDRPALAASHPESEFVLTRNLKTIAGGVGDAFQWLGGYVNYPPKQPRPPRTRRVPAVVHDLDLRFNSAGTLEHLRYRPHEGSALIPYQP